LPELNDAMDAPRSAPSANSPLPGESPEPLRPSDRTDADETAAVVEAILFAGEAPLPPMRIASVANLTAATVRQAVERLNRRYQQVGSAFRIEEIAGGLQMLTCPEYHDVLQRLLDAKKDSRLSQAALETLAIIAYRQPILRADIEAIRGVACGEVLRGLLEKQMIKIVGRAEVIGRPMLYGTTRQFLTLFGLARLDDLPRVAELREAAKDTPTPPPPPQDENKEEEEEEEEENEDADKFDDEDDEDEFDDDEDDED
jgi:segregation and condensation protein B